MSYNAYISKISNLKKHPNADRLQIGTCYGNQVVVGLDVTEGQIGAYFPTDGKLSMEFMEANNLIGKVDEKTGERTGGFFTEKGKVRTLKLRGERSDGFWIPISCLEYTGVKTNLLIEGFIFNELNGHKICEKYITEATRSSNKTKGKKNKKALKETVHYEIFHEHKDTSQLAYNYDQLKAGDVLVITSKCHGTSGRSSYTLVKKYTKFTNFINNIFHKEMIKPKVYWDYVYGSRRVTIKDENRKTGYYGENEDFRKKAHDYFAGKLHKGENIFYEIVGFCGPDKPIMAKVSNELLKDKEFIKQYGKETVFTYGCKPGEFEVYVYRISTCNEDGFEIDYDHETVKRRCEEMNVKMVPEIDISTLDKEARRKITNIEDDINSNLDDSNYRCPNFKKFIYDGDQELLKRYIDVLVEGPDPIDPRHIKEGIVLRVDGCKWKAYKAKSFQFKCLEGILKDDEKVIDMEEAEDIKLEV